MAQSIAAVVRLLCAREGRKSNSGYEESAGLLERDEMNSGNRFAACVSAILIAVGARPLHGQRVTIGPLVHVSKDLPSIRVDESLFCVDPNNPKHMFGGSHKAFYGIPKSNAAGNEHAIYAS